MAASVVAHIVKQAMRLLTIPHPFAVVSGEPSARAELNRASKNTTQQTLRIGATIEQTEPDEQASAAAVEIVTKSRLPDRSV